MCSALRTVTDTVAASNRNSFVSRRMPTVARCARSRARVKERTPMSTQVLRIRLAPPIRRREARPGSVQTVDRSDTSRRTKGITATVSYSGTPCCLQTGNIGSNPKGACPLRCTEGEVAAPCCTHITGFQASHLTDPCSGLLYLNLQSQTQSSKKEKLANECTPSKCPLLNGTISTDNSAADIGGFGSFSAPGAGGEAA